MPWQSVELETPSKLSMPIRVYEPETKGAAPPLVLYLRGGAFQQAEPAERETPIARALAGSGAVVVEADYGSISQNRFPNVLECSLAALHCLSSRRMQLGGAKSLLLVAGEEAGGNVAAGLALKANAD